MRVAFPRKKGGKGKKKCSAKIVEKNIRVVHSSSSFLHRSSIPKNYIRTHILHSTICMCDHCQALEDRVAVALLPKNPVAVSSYIVIITLFTVGWTFFFGCPLPSSLIYTYAHTYTQSICFFPFFPLPSPSFFLAALSRSKSVQNGMLNPLIPFESCDHIESKREEQQAESNVAHHMHHHRCRRRLHLVFRCCRGL